MTCHIVGIVTRVAYCPLSVIMMVSPCPCCLLSHINRSPVDNSFRCHDCWFQKNLGPLYVKKMTYFSKLFFVLFEATYIIWICNDISHSKVKCWLFDHVHDTATFSLVSLQTWGGLWGWPPRRWFYENVSCILHIAASVQREKERFLLSFAIHPSLTFCALFLCPPVFQTNWG